MKKITVKAVIHKGIEIMLAVALIRIFITSIGYVFEFIENIINYMGL
jgi:hypothetical protein